MQQILEQQLGRTQQNTHGFCGAHSHLHARAQSRGGDDDDDSRDPRTDDNDGDAAAADKAGPLRGWLVSFERD